MARLRKLWHQHRFIFIGFVAAALITVLFAIKTVSGVIYWSQHRNTSIEPWMTIGYIAHSYRIDPRTLGDALGLTREEARNKPVGEIAEDVGMEFPRLRTEIVTIIVQDKTSHD